ncbi:MAG: hypothetical protein SFW36_11430, partial [Leptolyngbyaceae cyanobacterium bins.59]|nr:hypothetical protein [Leptolyngbyaceae cyanobacterium bins.59]
MIDFHYRQYRCKSGDPLHCNQAQQQVQQDIDSKSCSECGFPAVLTEAKIRGNRGLYEITSWQGSRGLGRLYSALEQPDDRPVVIREYLLPQRSFNAQEIRHRKQAFARLAGLELADGRSQDFRLILPWEAITDLREDRCYLVTLGEVETYPSLKTELPRRGAMTETQVRRMLAQVLQTLEFLNSQKFRLPNGQIQKGLTHGNLSLENLLVSDHAFKDQSSENFTSTSDSSPSQGSIWGDHFLIYLCDLSLWEFLFAPPTTLLPEPSVVEDLADLGRIAFYLLSGSTTDPASGLPLDPKANPSFPAVSKPLQDFILRLIGMGAAFPSFTVAREALLKLPPQATNQERVLLSGLERDEKPPKPPFPWGTVFLESLLLLGMGIAWRWWVTQHPPEPIAAEKSLCCINAVSNLPTGRFTYTASEPSLWSYVLRQKSLIERDKTLEQILQDRHSQFVLTYQPETTPEAALQRLRSQQAEFMITSMTDQVTADLEAKTVAYDGLVIFVAFSYARRANSLPNALKGQITFDQLRRLYTGEIQNWKQLGGPDLPVRLYIPPEVEAIR